jgi:hypothetical protein
MPVFGPPKSWPLLQQNESAADYDRWRDPASFGHGHALLQVGSNAIKLGGFQMMNKIFSTLSVLTLASALAMPMFPRSSSPKAAKAQNTTASSMQKSKSKVHRHAKKHGASKGANKVQQGTNPASTK